MLVPFLLLEPYIFKVIFVGVAFYSEDSAGYFSVFINDAQIIIACYLFFKLAELVSGYLFYIFRGLAFLVYITYLLDIILILFFRTRLYVGDILGMYDEVFLFWSSIGFAEFAVLLFIILCATIFFQKPDVSKKKAMQNRLLLTVFASIFCVGFFYDSNTSVRSVFFRNYVDVNLKSTHSKAYTDQFILSFNYSPLHHCSQIETRTPDSVYIILVESWSNYHSEFFGLQNNWTPNLDNLASENISLNQFYANGYTTESGLYSLLTGSLPMLYGPNMKLDEAMGLMHYPITDTLPAKMVKLGYQPYFITSGDLNFLDKGKWLERIGFSTIIGADDYPENSQRYLFNSVSDGELFDRVEQVIQSDHQPKFVVVENVTTHSPFYSPGVNGETIRSEKAAFLYMDKLLSELIYKIKGENNLIIVMSDHRAMTSMTEREREKSGMMAVSMVPAFIMWNQKKWKLDKPFQQTDVMDSIVGLIQGSQCAGDVNGALFPIEQAISSRCIFHARGDSREMVTVKCKDEIQEFNIILDGDQTRAELDTTKSKLAVDIVNYTRIRQD